MRVLLLVIWMLIPVGVFAFHLGPGQNHLKLDQAAQVLINADALAAEEKWADAQTEYEKALTLVPDHRDDLRFKVQLQRAKAQMQNAQLPEANSDLQGLVATLVESKDVDPELLADARNCLANSQYYMTWLKRLEGLPREEWEPDITSAQQTLRLLAKQADSADDEAAFELHTKDLESAVRLARMDLGELQGLPLPNQ